MKTFRVCTTDGQFHTVKAQRFMVSEHGIWFQNKINHQPVGWDWETVAYFTQRHVLKIM